MRACLTFTILFLLLVAGSNKGCSGAETAGNNSQVKPLTAAEQETQHQTKLPPLNWASLSSQQQEEELDRKWKSVCLQAPLIGQEAVYRGERYRRTDTNIFAVLAENRVGAKATGVIVLGPGTPYEEVDGPTGVTPSPQAEFQKLLAAAEKGDAHAQYAVGQAIEQGTAHEYDDIAVPTNPAQFFETQRKMLERQHARGAKAAKWYLKAADQGNADAQCALGGLYLNGNGVPQDYRESVKWFRKAAEQGDPAGQSNLSRRYLLGQGVQADKVQAYKWLMLSARSWTHKEDQEAAESEAAELAGKMNSRQIALAERYVREFLAQKKQTKLTEFDSRDESNSSRPYASGTGFFIAEDGYLITNEHVVRNAGHVRLVTSAGTISAKVLKIDPANDLALLKAQGHFPVLPLAASRTVHLGNSVCTVGFPNIGLQGFAPKYARGEIAALSGPQDDGRYFQISVPLQPGNSGGALVDERGNVVGVVSAKLSASAALASSGALPENVNYAVKSSFLLSFLESVPEVSDKLQVPRTQKSEDVAKAAERAAVLVLVY